MPRTNSRSIATATPEISAEYYSSSRSHEVQQKPEKRNSKYFKHLVAPVIALGSLLAVAGEARANEQGPCPEGSHVLPGSWRDINQDGIMQFNEVACIWNTPPTTKPPTPPPTTSRPPVTPTPTTTPRPPVTPTPPIETVVVSQIDVDSDGYEVVFKSTMRNGQEVAREQLSCTDPNCVDDFADDSKGEGETGLEKMTTFLADRGLSLDTGSDVRDNLIKRIALTVNPNDFERYLTDLYTFFGETLPPVTTTTTSTTSTSSTTTTTLAPTTTAEASTTTQQETAVIVSEDETSSRSESSNSNWLYAGLGLIAVCGLTGAVLSRNKNRGQRPAKKLSPQA